MKMVMSKPGPKPGTEFVDEMSLDFKKLTKVLNLSNDFFVRTTETYHKKASQHIWTVSYTHLTLPTNREV